ncbi:uncharacterized protein BDW43DRAFT_300090 [Aspergillus alliaceus]|uniref:uncharacterized protein n=1 Tax=Petromyces alliaceus TaxID=209559 RepID=UPI0012A7154F|nr:uncharacterized protein BDW43DRAFT_300090 [Aspergillus alliaceus]KAB8233863.1 hypothetical protein BDW43DRAFT_300090 [Aspergillus alliaceus]
MDSEQHMLPVSWNRTPGGLDIDSGPSPICSENLTSYCLGLVETGFSRLPKEDSVNRELLPHQGSTQSHIRLLNIRQKVMEKLAQDTRIQDAATPALLHPDVNKRNIYVSTEEPSIITGLLDWRSASIEPTFIYANETPDFEQGRKDASICYQTYDVCMNGLVPKLRPARLLDPTLFRLFHHCHTTWRDTRWTELGLQGSYPYSPTEEKLKEDSKLWLRSPLQTNSDGWVPNDVWNAAKDAHRSRGEDRTVVKADKLWPFDAR